jgi:hypothetical protein
VVRTGIATQSSNPLFSRDEHIFIALFVKTRSVRVKRCPELMFPMRIFLAAAVTL